MKILLTADEAAGAHTLRLLNKSKHQLAAVITGENLPIRRLAEKMCVTVIEPSHLSSPSFSDWIRSQHIDVLLNVHLLEIIHPQIIHAVSFGAFNMHPGLLPDYAGLHTPSWAIYHREKSSGSTLHWLEKGVDSGPVAYQATVPVRPGDTGFSLSARCSSAGLDLISQLLDDLSSEAAIPKIPQDLSRRRYFGKKECPQNGCLDWSRSAAEIEALLRAYNYSPYPSPWKPPITRCQGADIEITSVKVTGEICREKPGTVDFNNRHELRVATSDFWVNIETCGFEGEQIAAGSVLKQGDVLE